MWAVDSFAALTTGVVADASDLPTDLYDETFALFNSATTIASAHGPVLRGAFIAGAFDRVRALAGQPNIPAPGQETLDALVAQALAGAGA
jgi:hypothetical protein